MRQEYISDEIGLRRLYWRAKTCRLPRQLRREERGQNYAGRLRYECGRYRIRTYDFHRVNFEVTTNKPLACFAFRDLLGTRTRAVLTIFGDELVTSCSTYPCLNLWDHASFVG